MALTTSEILLFSTVAALGIAYIVSAKPTQEPTQEHPQYSKNTQYPKNTIIIEEID